MEKTNEGDSIFQRIFESNMIGLLFCDDKGRVLRANDAFLRIVGYTREDLERGRIDWRALTPPEQLPATMDAIRQIRRTGSCHPFEKEYIHKDGHRVPVEVGGASSDGRDDGLIVTYVLDIADRKQTEQNLTSAQERLEQRVQERTKDLVETYSFLDSLLENIPNMIFVKDAKDLRFVRFNRAGEDLLGLSRDKLIGKNDYDFFPPAEADHFRDRDRAVLDGKTVVDIPEETISTATGQRILHTKKIPLFDGKGQPTYLLGISEDITEQKRTDAERLRLMQEQAGRVEAEKAADRFQFLAEASAVLSSSLNFEETLKNLTDLTVPRLADWCTIELKQPDGTLKPLAIAHADPSKVAWGWKMHEKFPFDPLTPYGSAAVFRSGVSEWVPFISEQSMDSQSLDPEHRQIITEIGLTSYICAPIRARGEIFGTLTLSTSKQSGRHYTETDRRLVEDLGERAGFAMENARLYKEAQSLNRVKDEFLATLSHELRTPLNVIQGYAELMLVDAQQMDAEETKAACQAIYRNAQSQTQIISDLLDVSSIITGKINFRPEKVSPAEIASSVVENAAATAASRRVRLSIDASEAPAEISADPTRLQQILWNLVSNALKFTPADGHVEVRVAREGDACVIQVTDSGSGIEESFLPYVFDRFRQEDSGTTRKFGGLGIGLAIVRHLAEMHGGTVQAESGGKGKGSRFSVRLPLMEHRPSGAVDQMRAGESFFASESGENIRLDGLRVLVLEDSEDNRQLVHHYLANAGAQVLEAGTAARARELLKDETPDIILSDIGLPGEDGVSFIRSVRASEAGRGKFTPAIALTAYVRNDEKDQMIKAGFQAHVSKPIARQQLLREVADLTRKP